MTYYVLYRTCIRYCIAHVSGKCALMMEKEESSLARSCTRAIADEELNRRERVRVVLLQYEVGAGDAIERRTYSIPPRVIQHDLVPALCSTVIRRRDVVNLQEVVTL